MAGPVLRVYSRYGCHLCEDMLQELQQFRAELGYQLEVYDVDDDPALLERFNALVPIVFISDKELFRYYFEYATLVDAIKNNTPEVGNEN